MIRLFLMLLLWFSILDLCGQTKGDDASHRRFSKYIGKYGINGMVVQVAVSDGVLMLVVPGAPLQEMTPAGANKFKSATFDDSYFLFVESDGKIKKMVSQSPQGSMELDKISDAIDNFNGGDSLLTMKKSIEHFTFLYSTKDSVNITNIVALLNSNYGKILHDFKVQKIPLTTVRIYPDLQSFHRGINFPDAPPNVQATAFGKNDFRMVSRAAAGSDSLQLVKGVVHEFVHIVHLNIDYAPNNPRWLWEGVAMFEADWFLDPKEIDVVKNKNFPSFAALNNGLEYELGYVIIEAIKDIWGFDAVINLIKKRGDTLATLHISQAQFEEKIYDHIFKKYIQH